MSNHHKINYIEMPSKDLEATKAFFTKVFSWGFVDYGPEYSSITNAGIDGGFFTSKLAIDTQAGSALVVLYSESLELTQQQVVDAGGEIIQDIFEFPGGRRFHFKDPNSNEFAVWSDK
ncbi:MULTISPECIES: VOC family protein [Gammaproteobacteria]|uniref:VOC family protein n=1 Tax=Gammaproteobacteria TaxID=1236 RepID=UPI000DCF8FE6|nr:MULTISPECIES: VOC family protein [Gammaproteobacteria]RTE87751.1 VOC family protein [Aliidiomarina sp. B3213]TCZ92467.1 VOC family protein [Lysobacter sp. N42]